MWDLNTLNKINQTAAKLGRAGKPERDALFLVTDVRRRGELAALEANDEATVCRTTAGCQCCNPIAAIVQAVSGQPV